MDALLAAYLPDMGDLKEDFSLISEFGTCDPPNLSPSLFSSAGPLKENNEHSDVSLSDQPTKESFDWIERALSEANIELPKMGKGTVSACSVGDSGLGSPESVNSSYTPRSTYHSSLMKLPQGDLNISFASPASQTLPYGYGQQDFKCGFAYQDGDSGLGSSLCSAADVNNSPLQNMSQVCRPILQSQTSTPRSMPGYFLGNTSGYLSGNSSAHTHAHEITMQPYTSNNYASTIPLGTTYGGQRTMMPASPAGTRMSMVNPAILKTPTNGTSGGKFAHQPAQDTLEKPVESYIALIAKAILQQPTRRAILADIYSFVTTNYPYYKDTDSAWKSSVRHNLSVNECFIKVGQAESCRGFYWAIHPACVEAFLQGDFRRREARKRAQKMYNTLNGHNNTAPKTARKSTTFHPYKRSGFVPMTSTPTRGNGPKEGCGISEKLCAPNYTQNAISVHGMSPVNYTASSTLYNGQSHGQYYYNVNTFQQNTQMYTSHLANSFIQ